MNVILDTHVILWALYSPEKLSQKAKDIIMDPDNSIVYSVASIWEFEIKRLKHPEVFEFDAHSLVGDCKRAGYIKLGIDLESIYELSTLKEVVNHSDPFDRMLIVQAKANNYPLLTRDKKLFIYDEPCVQYI